MGAYKDKNGTWYAQFRFTNWKGEADRKTKRGFHDYYDDIEVCGASAVGHFKGAHQKRNREMVDRSNLIVCYIERENGGAWQTVKYAMGHGKTIYNLSKDDDSVHL